ncbi:MAG: type II toxin-antitoxin system Phd/YefM family antitoxin [Myxococcota bacterium]
MDISVTDFKQRCLEIIRRVERTGHPVAITRRGRVVAQLRRPAAPASDASQKPWERLRRAGGRLLAAPSESVLSEEELEATR